MEVNAMELSAILRQLSKCEIELKQLKGKIEDMKKEIEKKG